MPRKRSSPVIAALLLLALETAALAKDKPPRANFSPSAPVAPAPAPANGSIFQGNYVPLTSGARAGQVGDILTVQLVERTNANKSSASGTQRDANIGLTPPTTGPFALFGASDTAMGGGQQFQGKGEASQSNSLVGELTVTVAAVFPNGTMLIRGEKKLTLNRGDEWLQLSGLVRAVDISPDNRIASTRVANAEIHFVGKGDVARSSRQGWLQRFFSMISPF